MLNDAQWTQVVEQAVRAPSIHNSQPWSFTVRGNQLDVRLDPARALPAIDPTGRQQVVSCGVAVEFAVVALAALGHDAEVDVLPDRGDEQLLATVRLTGTREATADDTALAEGIAARHTDRSPFREEPLPAELFDRLQSEIGRDGIWLQLIARAEEEAAVAVLLDQAEQSEQRDPAYLAELRAWTRTDPAAPDGVPVAALPHGDRATNFVVRDFTSGDPGPAPAPASAPADDDPPPRGRATGRGAAGHGHRRPGRLGAGREGAGAAVAADHRGRAGRLPADPGAGPVVGAHPPQPPAEPGRCAADAAPARPAHRPGGGERSPPGDRGAAPGLSPRAQPSVRRCSSAGSSPG
jgi:nitroreductase